MARTVMDIIQENVNPVSVSNALYEMMVDWRNCVLLLEGDRTKSKRNIRHKKVLIERYLSWFMGVSSNEMRDVLAKHFGVKP